MKVVMNMITLLMNVRDVDLTTGTTTGDVEKRLKTAISMITLVTNARPVNQVSGIIIVDAERRSKIVIDYNRQFYLSQANYNEFAIHPPENVIHFASSSRALSGSIAFSPNFCTSRHHH